MAEEMIKVVTERLVNLFFAILQKEIDYISKCTEHVKLLISDVDELMEFKKQVEKQIDIAKSRGDNLLPGVEKWVEDTNSLVARVEKIFAVEDTCLSLRMCQNLGTLRQYGKKAIENSRFLQQHLKEGKIYERCCSDSASAPGFLEIYERKNHTDIGSQNSTLSKIIDAIKDEKIQVIKIYGTGGCGKTTLALEAAARVGELFDYVVCIPVSQNLDYEKIKKEAQIAAKRIQKKDKVLIILDDVWHPLKMINCGIPVGKNHMNCKILITSRIDYICSGMTAVRSICVDLLSKEEAWILFRRMVGETLENNEGLETIAKEIAEECHGLPLVIEVVGKSLQDKDDEHMKAMCYRMKQHASHATGLEIKETFHHLSLSYDYLENDEAKSCFLLCSMFPEDSFISLECLALYGVGLRMFAGLKNIQDARNRIRISVNTLKSYSLLLNGDSHKSTKMHDIIREVALSISSENEGKNKFLVNEGKALRSKKKSLANERKALGKWPPNNSDLESYTGMSLMQSNISELVNRKLHVPHLDIFLIQDNPELSMIPDEFIKGLENVKVLDMEHTNISSLPSSMKLLTKLRMLNLGRNRSLSEISELGQLTELEILILNDTGIERIPEEIGQLKSLRLLEVRRCHNLSHIADGVISKLSLEELNIGFYSVQERTYSSLEKLCEVPSYVVQIGGGHETSFDIPLETHSANCLILEIPCLPNSMPIKKLIEASDYIYLKSIVNVSNIMPNLRSKGLNEVKTVQLINCKNVSCLVDTRDWDETKTFFSSNDLGEFDTTETFFSEMQSVILRDMAKLEVLWNCPHQYISFCKLETISISFCPNLAMLFPVSIAQGLVNLRSIALSSCGCLEYVICAEDEGTSDTKIEFPKLTTINLDQLPKLKSFHSGDCTIKYPSLQLIKVSGCSSLNTWGSGHHEIPKIKYHYQGKLCNINDFLAICSEKNEAMTFENKVIEADYNG